MKRILFAFLSCLILTLFHSLPLRAQTLCHEGEQTLFSCQIKSSPKTASLCGSKSLTSNQGSLQYRFGSLNKVELEFPREKQNSQKAFRYAHYFRFQVDETELSFDNSGTTYTIFSVYNGEEKPAVDASGVRVTMAGKSQKEVELLCRKPVTNQLGLLKKIVPCDKQSGLNMGECPP